MTNYWQIGSGAGDRDYSQECFDFGIAFTNDKETMRRVRKDDAVVLRKGVKETIAAGKVVEYRGEAVGFADACFSANCQHGNKAANRENCKLIIESKHFSSRILKAAPEQAKEYAENLPNCKTILVSNGYCYKAFTRDGSEKFSDTPSAYLNLRTPKCRYPLEPSVGGALEVLQLLLPWS